MVIFQRGSPMVSVKKSTIFSSVFFSKIGLEIMLSYGLERKEAFEDDKKVSFLKSKKWASSEGVNPWFRSKAIRCSFFLWLAGMYSVRTVRLFFPSMLS